MAGSVVSRILNQRLSMSRDPDKVFVRDHIGNPISVKMSLVNIYGFVQSTVPHTGASKTQRSNRLFTERNPLSVSLICCASQGR